MAQLRTVARGAAALAVAGILTVMTALPASAAEATTDPDGTTDTVVVQPGESKTAESPDGSLQMTLELGEPTTVTTSQIANDEGLSAAAKSELLSVAAVSSVKSNHWSQFTTGGAYTQTQNGTFYYNGSRVWVTQTYAGRKGSHKCFTNYVVTGWSISNISKSDSGTTSRRSLTCGWNVTQPILVTTYAEMTAKISKNGTISGFGATVG